MRQARRYSRGVSLIEAVVALGVMAFGMLGVAGMQSSLRQNADIARQRAEAVRLADEAIEQARAYSVVNTDGAGVKRAYEDIATLASPESIAGRNATYARAITVNEVAAMGYKSLKVEVTWDDRTGNPQSVLFGTQILRSPPELAASLIIPGSGTVAQNPGGRDSSIPSSATPNGDGTSTFNPPGAGPIAWVFTDSTGMVEKRCVGSVCSAAGFYARLLQGYISFDRSTPGSPDSRGENPVGDAMPVSIVVNQTAPLSAAAGECFYEDLPAAPATAKVVGYYCLVRVTAVTGVGSNWSGSTQLSGLTIAASITDPSLGAVRVCRYTPYKNQNAVGTGSPPITNDDHPKVYTSVDHNLVNQNFLVAAAGDGAAPFECPDDNPSTPLINGRTWHHQPST
jgi:Tfp pilus assembly protein PilV